MGEGVRRGRPREYDEDAVLDAVLDVFWRKGYAAATLPDLAAAAGISRPSLYTALGDKLSMYLRSLDRFGSRLGADLTAELDPSRPLADGLTGFYRSAIDRYCDHERPRGCLALCTAVTEAVEEPEIRAALARIMASIDAAFEARLSAAAAEGGAAGSVDIAGLTAVASATLHSLAMRARAGHDRERLMGLASATTHLIASAVREAAGSGPPRPTHRRRPGAMAVSSS